MKNYIFSFEEANGLGPDKLGGKGASLVQMQSWGIPVPPGFIITTDAGKEFSKNGFQIKDEFKTELREQLTALEVKARRITGQPLKFGDRDRPLLISVRSGAPVSMPGQMSTLLNIGLTHHALNNSTYDDKLTLELYWRLYRSFAFALGIDRVSLSSQDQSRFSSTQHKESTESIKRVLYSKYGNDFIKDLEQPENQLWMAIKAVWASWDTPTNQAYRRSLGVNDDAWTAVVVQMMVLGNKNSNSGTGVVYSRDLRTGKNEDPLPGSFLFKAQGEEVVSGEAKGDIDLRNLQKGNSKLYKSLRRHVDQLEKELRNPLDIEFTIEDGKLWFLQARTAPISDRAMIEFVVDLVQRKDDWNISEREAVERIRPSLMERLYLPVFSKDARENAIKNGRLLTKGSPASPGVAVGKIAITVDTANRFARDKQSFIWVRDALDPKEHQVMRSSVGVISIRSSVGSHGAIMANVLKKPCIVCCENLEEVNEEARYIVVNGRRIQEDESVEISVDAIRGEVFLGSLPAVASESFPALKTFEKWWDKFDGTKENSGLISPEDGKPHSPWGNATRSSDFDVVDKLRQQAREYLLKKGWNTEKAQVAEVMYLIPEEMRIKQVVVEATDKDALANAMRDVFKKKRSDGTPFYWNGPRTALGPGAEGAAPWQMGMKTEEQIQVFLTQRDFQGVAKAKSGGYPRWMEPGPNDPPPPVQIIVMYDPAEKGVEEFEPDHFVCNVSCRSNPDEVSVDINVGTAQLRSFEKIKPENLIRLTMELNPAIPDFRGRRVLIFGRSHWNLDEVAHLPAFSHHNPDQIAGAIEEGMNNGDLSDETLIALVGKRNLRIARYVESQVFGDWWTKNQLPYRMRALDEVFSLQVLEIQGRAGADGGVIWFLVYDAKGRDEKKTIAEATR